MACFFLDLLFFLIFLIFSFGYADDDGKSIELPVGFDLLLEPIPDRRNY